MVNHTKEDIKKLPYFDQKLNIEQRVQDLLKRLNLDEKLSLLSGEGMWGTTPIKRLQIPSFRMSDGPHGFRNAQSTFFPIAKCRASTWNPDLSYQFGEALAEEVRANNYQMILGPGINLDRTPLNGRTFEYLTEDPYLNSVLAVATVNGIQSKRIAACVKHFVANNQETDRHEVSAEVSERALQEIYLPGFRACVEKAQAWSIMTAYNRINGIFACKHQDLLINKLRKTWNFSGFVVTDWWATRSLREKSAKSAAMCLNNGLNLEMPGASRGRNRSGILQFTKKNLQAAFKENKITLDTIDERISEMLHVMFNVGLFDDEKTLPEGSTNTKAHQAIARKIANEGIVLLKNKNQILPLNSNKITNITILGPNKDKKMASGGGSATLNPPYEITPLVGLKEKIGQKAKISTKKSDVANADAVILCLGLNHDKGYDTEGHDRNNLQLPLKQISLIKETTQKNPNVIVVLINGSPIAMPWEDKVSAIVEAWYAGMQAGRAIADVLFGDINPSGKLPITFPKRIADSPAHRSKQMFPGIGKKVSYEEGIFVGYRWFDSRKIEPLFPFGHGLSYTNFKYSDLKLNKSVITPQDELVVKITVENIGKRSGAEVVQLYIQDTVSREKRPPRELKRFKKTFLASRKTETITFKLKADDLSYYSEKKQKWVVESGEFLIFLGSSSRDIRATKSFELKV